MGVWGFAVFELSCVWCFRASGLGMAGARNLFDLARCVLKNSVKLRTSTQNYFRVGIIIK